MGQTPSFLLYNMQRHHSRQKLQCKGHILLYIFIHCQTIPEIMSKTKTKFVICLYFGKNRAFEKNFKKNQKNFKKGIDKRQREWYNVKAVAKKHSDRTLTIEQQIKEVQSKKASANIKSVKNQREHNSKKVKKVKISSNGSDRPRGRRIYNLFESLILAQDERWRRA